MGTHPIFESDFDCLTDFKKMSLNGKWKQASSDNAVAFVTAIGGTQEQLEKMAKTKIELTYKVDGNTVTTTRSYSGAGAMPAITNTGTIGGGECEYQLLSHKIKVAITGSDGDLTLKAVSGWATATAKIVGNQLVETVTHHESGTVMTNTWDRA